MGDNGQLAWSMIAVVEALRGAIDRHPEAKLLQDRYQAHVNLMADSAKTIFGHDNPERGRVYSRSRVKNVTGSVALGNYKKRGLLGDPFEGELMVMFMDLMCPDLTDGQKSAMWRKVRNGNGKATYHDGPDGPIDVQRGWKFSAHELWKYLVLPYLENPTLLRVAKNAERARTWHAFNNEIPGLMASCYFNNVKYVDRLGVNELSGGYTEPPDNQRMVTPYGAYPLILVKRGLGLAWHRAMLGRSRMQAQYGSVEGISAVGEHVALKMTWDTKVTTDLALLGGTGSLIKQFLKRESKYQRFKDIVEEQHAQFKNLDGENTSYALPPGSNRASDFANCACT